MTCAQHYDVPADMAEYEMILNCEEWGMTSFEWLNFDWTIDEDLPKAACRFEDRTCEEYFGSQVPGGCIDNIAVDCTLHGPYPVVDTSLDVCDLLEHTCETSEGHSAACY